VLAEFNLISELVYRGLVGEVDGAILVRPGIDLCECLRGVLRGE
tara:strand:+ start:893 stop:1024 length:132 start_codon:yes stop_codon:yes gene_type:complete